MSRRTTRSYRSVNVEVMDPKRLVRESYEALAPRYLEWAESVRVTERRRYTDLLMRELDPGAGVLDLGCGPGGSTTRSLATRFHVIGVDISWANVVLAKAAVPAAQFVQGDMTEIELRPRSLDGVAAFYPLIHVPRREQPAVLARVAEWLRPGGLVVASVVMAKPQAVWADYTHVRGFTRRSAELMFRDQGFHVESIWQMGGIPLTTRLGLIEHVPRMLRLPFVGRRWAASWELRARRPLG